MHYHKIKMTAAAMAMAVLVTGNMPAAESDQKYPGKITARSSFTTSMITALLGRLLPFFGINNSSFL